MAELEELLEDLLAGLLHKATPLPSLTRSMAAAIAALSAVEQPVALAAARSSGLRAAHTVPLLKRAMIEDPDGSTDTPALVTSLCTILSGYGLHASTFSGASVCLSLHCRPQAQGTGSRLWPAARLAVWASESRWAGLDVRGRNCLELGCGTAAVGLSLAALGAADVWITDWDVSALELAQHNAELNGLDHVRAFMRNMSDPMGAYSPLPSAAAAQLPPLPAFDLVVASDVIYDQTEPAKVLETIVRALKDGAVGAKALIVHSSEPSRSEGARRAVGTFLECCAGHPQVRCVAQMTPAADLDLGGGCLAEDIGGQDIVMQLLELRDTSGYQSSEL